MLSSAFMELMCMLLHWNHKEQHFLPRSTCWQAAQLAKALISQPPLSLVCRGTIPHRSALH